jgi:hypothetical protein
MYTELNDSCSTVLAFAINHLLFREAFHHRFGTSSLALDQMSITLLYFSPWVTKPEAYCDSISFNFRWQLNDARLWLRDDEVVHTNR